MLDNRIRSTGKNWHSILDEWADEITTLQTERNALVELQDAAISWLWHQGKSGSPHYTSAPSELIAKNDAKKRLIEAIEALTGGK